MAKYIRCKFCISIGFFPFFHIFSLPHFTDYRDNADAFRVQTGRVRIEWNVNWIVFPFRDGITSRCDKSKKLTSINLQSHIQFLCLLPLLTFPPLSASLGVTFVVAFGKRNQRRNFQMRCVATWQVPVSMCCFSSLLFGSEEESHPTTKKIVKWKTLLERAQSDGTTKQRGERKNEAKCATFAVEQKSHKTLAHHELRM